MPRNQVIPDDVRAILDTPVLVTVGTINPDGTPQLSVVWLERVGDLLHFSTVEGRAKPRNLRRDPRVTLSLTPLDQPRRCIVIKGRAIEIEQKGMDLIDRMARKYEGHEKYRWAKPGQVRTDVTIEVDRVNG